MKSVDRGQFLSLLTNVQSLTKELKDANQGNGTSLSYAPHPDHFCSENLSYSQLAVYAVALRSMIIQLPSSEVTNYYAQEFNQLFEGHYLDIPTNGV